MEDKRKIIKILDDLIYDSLKVLSTKSITSNNFKMPCLCVNTSEYRIWETKLNLFLEKNQEYKNILCFNHANMLASDYTQIILDKLKALQETLENDLISENDGFYLKINSEIYNHIKKYLKTNNYFHAIEESYKIVREKLREITGDEKATNAFKEENFEKIFGHKPTSQAEKDFFDGVKYLNMSIQMFRNEKAHKLAKNLDKNRAYHYIALASLAYDLIVSD